ncbi:MAG: GNAT family N-acetyltransferase [Oscillospiraceae bacterium]|nr:GNAT family N-acetyltransferase [Oscillospiraceae bacterium]
MMELRDFIPSDAEMIINWTGDETAFRKWCADRYDHYPIMPQDMISQYAGASQNGRFFPYTACEDGIPVGHMIVRFPDEDMSTARFGFVIVDPGKRGQGIGRKMLELAMRISAEKYGARQATLGVFANNEPAHRCYLAAGFTDVPDAEKEYYHIFGEDWLCTEMKCDL